MVGKNQDCAGRKWARERQRPREVCEQSGEGTYSWAGAVRAVMGDVGRLGQIKRP